MATAGDGPGSGPERAFASELEGRVALDPEESAHLVRSRRVREGATVVLFDGRGGSVEGTLVRADPRGAVVEVRGPHPDREPARWIRLATALPEAGRADRLVAQLAELGVGRVDWLRAERSAPDRDALPARRRARWLRLAREAAKVNGRSRLLEIGEVPVSLEALLTEARTAALLLDPDPSLVTLPACLGTSGPLPLVCVGPEGGWTDAERTAAEAGGALRARLGLPALRIGTAALASAAILSAVA